MNKEEQYFVLLLKDFLRHNEPSVVESIDWQAIYNLAESQQVLGAIANMVTKLPKGTIINQSIYSHFVQNLGFAVENFDKKEVATKQALNTLINAKIRHIVVKGGIIKYLYPAPELRSSGDTDIIIEERNMAVAKKALLQNGFKMISERGYVLIMSYKGEVFEIHNNSDVQLDYFDECFKIATTSNSYTYKFNDTDHLFYVIAHIIKHIKSTGVGIRMIMDVDVLISNTNIDFERLYSEAVKNGISTATKMIIALANYFFDTKAKVDYSFDNNTDFLNKLTDFVLQNGVFGCKEEAGIIRLRDSISSSKNSKFPVKLNAFFRIFYVSKDALQNRFVFAKKHPSLLGLAYIIRLFASISVKRKQTKKTLQGIFTKKDEANNFAQILKEMKIDL